MPSTSSSSAAVTQPRRLNRSGRKVPISSSSSSSLAGVVFAVVVMTTTLLLLGASNDDGHRHHAGLPSFVGVVVVDAYRGPVVSPTKRRTWWFKTSPSYADHEYEYEYDSHGKHHHHNNNAFARTTTGPAADSAAAVLGGGGSDGSIDARPMVADEYRQVMEALPSPLMDATGHLIDSPQALAQLVSSQRVALYFAGSPCSRGLTMAAAGSYNHHQDNDHEDDDDENDHDNDGRYFARHHRRGQDLDDLEDLEDLDDSSCCVLVDPSTTVDEVEFMLPQYREALQQTNQAVQLIYVPSCDDTVETQLERMQELGLELGVPIGPASDALKKKFAIWSAAEVARLYGNNNNGNVNGNDNDNDNDNDVDSRMTTSTSTTQSTTATPWGRQHNDSIDQQQRRAGDLPARRSGVPAFVVLNTDGEELAFLNTKRHSIQALGEWPLDDPKGIW